MSTRSFVVLAAVVAIAFIAGSAHAGPKGKVVTLFDHIELSPHDTSQFPAVEIGKYRYITLLGRAAVLAENTIHYACYFALQPFSSTYDDVTKLTAFSGFVGNEGATDGNTRVLGPYIGCRIRNLHSNYSATVTLKMEFTKK